MIGFTGFRFEVFFIANEFGNRQLCTGFFTIVKYLRETKT